MEEYSKEQQELFLGILITEKDLWVRCSSIIKPEYFHQSLKKTVMFIIDYSEKFGGVPAPDIIKANTGIRLDTSLEITDDVRDYFLENLEKFCRHRALELWLTDGYEYVKKGNYGQLEKELKDALLISLYSNLGTKYFENPKERLLKIKESNGQVSTGWKALDEKLYGGVNRGELNVFSGNSGAGKSLFLQNVSLNWAFMGLNVVYVSLELSEELIAMRMDAMVAETSTKEIFKKIETVHDKVVLKAKDAGCIWIKKLPQGSTVNHIKSYLKELEIKEGKRPDALVVDYMDLLLPNDRRIDPSNIHIKDKYVAEELRGLAEEGNGPEHRLLLMTASQFNKGAGEEHDFSHSDIAGGHPKIQTSDNWFGIYTSRVLKDRGRYQLQMMKTRNSGEDGTRIDLSFDIVSMRITDLDDDELEDDTTNNVMNQLKQKSQIKRKDSQIKDQLNSDSVTEDKLVSDITKPNNPTSVLDLVKDMKK